METALEDCNRAKESQLTQISMLRSKADAQVEDLMSQLKDCKSRCESYRYQVDNLQRQLTMSSIQSASASTTMSSPQQVTITRRKYVTDASGGSPGSRSYTTRTETRTSGGVSGSGGGNVSSSTEKSLHDFFSSDSPKGESTGLEFDDEDDEPEVTTKRVVVKSARTAKK